MTAPTGPLYIAPCGRLVEEQAREVYPQGVKVRCHVVRDGSWLGWLWLEQLTPAEAVAR